MKKKSIIFTLGIVILLMGCNKTEIDVKDVNEVVKMRDNIEIENKEDGEDGEEIFKNGDIIFSTEYKIEDYCKNRFIVSKSDGLLYGLLNEKGEEIIPVEYDKLNFVNYDTVISGVDEKIYINAEYEGETTLFDCEGKKMLNVEVRRSKCKLGEVDKNTYFFENSNSKNLELYNEKGEIVTSVSFENIRDENGNKLEEITYVCQEWISPQIFLLCITGKVSGENGDKYPSKTIIYNTNGEIIREWNGVTTYRALLEDENRIIIYIVGDKENLSTNLYSCDEYGNLEELGLLENSQQYILTAISGLEKSTRIISEIEAESEKAFHLGEDNKYLLYKTNETWKLIDENRNPIYDERYYECYPKKNGYFLQNEDKHMCFINKAAKMIVPYEFIEFKNEAGYLNGIEITDKNFFNDGNSVVFVEERDGVYSVHLFKVDLCEVSTYIERSMSNIVLNETNVSELMNINFLNDSSKIWNEAKGMYYYAPGDTYIEYTLENITGKLCIDYEDKIITEIRFEIEKEKDKENNLKKYLTNKYGKKYEKFSLNNEDILRWSFEELTVDYVHLQNGQVEIRWYKS